MFSSRTHGMTRLHFIAQLVVVLALVWISYLLVNWLRFDWALSAESYIDVSAILFATAFLEFFTRPVELRQLSGLSKQDLGAVSHRQTLFSLLMVFGTMVMFKDDSLSRAFLVVFFASYIVWITWSNLFGYRILHRHLYGNRSKGHSPTLLVGSPSAVRGFVERDKGPKPPGTEIMGFISVGSDGTASLRSDVPYLGTLEDIREVCERTKTRVLLMLGLSGRRDVVRPVSDVSSELGLRTMWLEDIRAGFGSDARTIQADKYSVVSSSPEPLEDPVNRTLKRGLDLLLSGIGIMLFLPPAILFTLILHRLYSKGPLFYKQERSGRNGEPFKMFKFRSMHTEGETAEFEQAREGDPRVFKGGLLLRRWSIDELPQLINVFRGEMSIVGPRPHPIPLDERLVKESRVYRLRHLAKPGLTGLAQCRGWRGETKSPGQVRNRIRLDLFYIRKWSFTLDLRIIVETAWRVIRPHRSAY